MTATATSRPTPPERLQGMTSTPTTTTSPSAQVPSDPSTGRAAAGPTTRTHTTTSSPLGELVLVTEDEALVGLYLPGHLRGPAPDRLGPPVDAASSAVLADTTRQLREYFAGDRTRFALPLRPVGTPLQQRVWALLTEIPYGRTTTYGELARQLGGPGLARAVGAANARNPISIVVPCHRVVGGDGRLTGYAGGLDRKRWLLALESSPLPARVLT